MLYVEAYREREFGLRHVYLLSMLWLNVNHCTCAPYDCRTRDSIRLNVVKQVNSICMDQLEAVVYYNLVCVIERMHTRLRS